MRKTIQLMMMAALMATSVQAAQVTSNQALDIARRFVQQGTARFNASAGNALKLAHEARDVNGATDYYVFNRGDQGGFIVVSGDDRVQPVWGYCDHGSFDYEKMPENVKWWFGEYQRQMQYLRDNPQVKARKAITLNTVVAPLMTTKWNQCRPYNDMCPIAPHSNDPYLVNGGRAYTGCVATATAQIMNYHKWPVKGTGTKTYDFDLTYYDTSAGAAATQPMTLTADFSQSTYQWDLMKDEYLYMDKNNYGYFDENWHVYIKVIDENGDTITDPNGMYGNAVAKLMSDVGIAVEMMYGYNGSGAYSANVYYALRDYFGYLVGYGYRDQFEDDWDETLRGELTQGRPVYISGAPDTGGGHAFVFDGFDSEGRFHVNWGWGGYYDGYFESLSLDPGGSNYNSYQEFVACMPYTPLTVVPGDGETIDFGKLWIGGLGANQTDSEVVVSGLYLEQDVTVTITGDDAAMFEAVATLPVDLVNQDGGYAFKVYYKPTARGQHSAQLVIDCGSSTVTLALTGQSGLYYDVNDDGVVSVKDVTELIDILLEGGDLNYTGQAAVIGDVTKLIDYLLGQ